MIEHTEGLFQTNRSDWWWLEPFFTGLGFFCFVIYTTWAMFQGNYYWWNANCDGFGGYLSPFYSPLLFIDDFRPCTRYCLYTRVDSGSLNCNTNRGQFP